MGITERKERERVKRRSIILDAARNALSKHGFDNCSMDRIAEEAELSKGTLYLYFRNRDELIIALLTQDLTSLIDKLESRLKEKIPPDKKLLRTISTFQKFSETHEIFYRTITHVNMRSIIGCGDASVQMTATIFHDLNTRMIDMVADVVQEGIDIGMFSSAKPARYVVMQLMLTMKGILVVTQNALFPPAWDRIDGGKLLNETAHLMIKGLKCQQQ